MKFIELEGTFSYHLNKPESRKVLEAISDTKKSEDKKDVKYLAELFVHVVNTLRGTKAWGKPKTNKLIHKLKGHLEAVMNEHKKNRSTGYAQANYILDRIYYSSIHDVKDKSNYPIYNPGVPADLDTVLSQAEALLATV